ncbi:MAG: hypothetical protein K2Z81_13995 [Cyanobacteria bacterium]|nr:hypothetical protein [Cyanobacteriota bacterium]
MLTKVRFEELSDEANKLYHEGNFSEAEEKLFRATKLEGVPNLRKEQVYDQLAGLACEQGLFNSAAFWYLKVLQNRSRRLTLNDPEMKASLRNYRTLLLRSRMGSEQLTA